MIAQDLLDKRPFFGGRDHNEFRNVRCDPARAPLFDCVADGALVGAYARPGRFFYLAYFDPTVDARRVFYSPNGLDDPSVSCPDVPACIKLLKSGTGSILRVPSDIAEPDDEVETETADAGESEMTETDCGQVDFAGTPTTIIVLRGTDCAEAVDVASAYAESIPPAPWECFLAHEPLEAYELPDGASGTIGFSCGYGGGAGDVRDAPHALVGVSPTP